MATLVIPNTIADGQVVTGSPHAANYTAIRDFVNTNVMQRDGSIAMTGALMLSDGNVAASVAAINSAVAAAAPPGAVTMFGGAVTPTGWLACNGAEVSRATYSALFAAVGVTYGPGNGTTTFTLPNLQGRFPVGRNAADALFDVRGETGGSKDAVVVTHAHTTDINHTHAAGSTSAYGHSHQVTTDSSLHFHDNNDSGNLIGFGSPNVSNYWRPANTIQTATDNHTHVVTIPALGADLKASAPTGVAATNANLPPFMVFDFIIKT